MYATSALLRNCPEGQWQFQRDGSGLDALLAAMADAPRVARKALVLVADLIHEHLAAAAAKASGRPTYDGHLHDVRPPQPLWEGAANRGEELCAAALVCLERDDADTQARQPITPPAAPTLSRTNVQTTLPRTNVQTILSRANVQTTLSRTNVRSPTTRACASRPRKKRWSPSSICTQPACSARLVPAAGSTPSRRLCGESLSTARAEGRLSLRLLGRTLPQQDIGLIGRRKVANCSLLPLVSCRDSWCRTCL